MIFLVAVSASSRRPDWINMPASFNCVSTCCDGARCGLVVCALAVAHTANDARMTGMMQPRRSMARNSIQTHNRVARSEDAPLDQPTTSGRTLEDEFEGELHLPAPLLINVAGKIASVVDVDRKSTRLNSSHGYISYAVFCLKKKNINLTHI